jgi:hypothetical protein
MTYISADALADIGLDRRGPCLSVFMPAESAGAAVKQDQVRLAKLLQSGVAVLVKRGMRRADAEALVEPAEKLIARAGLWSRKGGGIAVYLAPGVFKGLRAQAKLEETVTAGPRFVVRPLLQLAQTEAPFYVLALSRGSARLLRVDGGGLAEAEVPGMPPSLAATEQFDQTEGQRQVQSHTSGSSPAGRGGQTFHGHGGERDWKAEALNVYLRQASDAVSKRLRQAPGPVVLAAPDEVAAVFRRVTKLQGLLPVGVPGTTERLSGQTIMQRAADVVSEHALRMRAAASKRLTELYGRGRAAKGVETVLQAAHTRRVSDLFVASDAEAYGMFDPAAGRVTPLPQDALAADDLLDLAAALTLREGCNVYAVPFADMPEAAGEEPLAAILRDR